MPESMCITVDADELERVASAVVRETPAHLVPGELRRRLGMLGVRREPSAAVKARAAKIVAEAKRR